MLFTAHSTCFRATDSCPSQLVKCKVWFSCAKTQLWFEDAKKSQLKYSWPLPDFVCSPCPITSTHGSSSQVQICLVTPVIWWPRSLGSAFILLPQREDGVEVGTSRWGGSSATFGITLVWSLHWSSRGGAALNWTCVSRLAVHRVNLGYGEVHKVLELVENVRVNW